MHEVWLILIKVSQARSQPKKHRVAGGLRVRFRREFLHCQLFPGRNQLFGIGVELPLRLPA